MLLGCQLIKERVKLGAVAQALLDLQELLQDAVRRDREAEGRRNAGITDSAQTSAQQDAGLHHRAPGAGSNFFMGSSKAALILSTNKRAAAASPCPHTCAR